MPLYFYSTSETHSDLSSFSPHGFEHDGFWWPTVEHYFQAQKFSDEKHIERIKRANSPREAKRLGGSRQFPIRADWDEVRDEVMFQACLKKFQANDDVKKLLLSTGEEELIENAPNDYYWGCGKNGTGQNQLGKTLMRVRKLLRSPGPN